MNIFYLDQDITKCAQAHVDKHVSKLILEAAQMMATAIRKTRGELDTVRYLTTKGTVSKNRKKVYLLEDDHLEVIDDELVITSYENNIYLNGYEKHPCTLWVQESIDNYMWLYYLCQELNEECLYRGYNEHLSWKKIQSWPLPELPNKGLTEHARAFKDPYKEECMAIESTLEAYRHYYQFGKFHLMTYTKRKPPEWLPQDIWVKNNDVYRII